MSSSGIRSVTRKGKTLANGHICDIFIVVEQRVLGQLSSFSQALLYWLVVNYVFNLQYHKHTYCALELFYKDTSHIFLYSDRYSIIDNGLTFYSSFINAYLLVSLNITDYFHADRRNV